MATRKLIPLKDHKHEMTRICFRTYCECGWSSCAHWERSEAYGEWRQHIIACGGEYEPWEKAFAREDRVRAKHKKEMLARTAPV